MNTIEAVVEFLKNHKLQLATAESCTAGLITSLIANVSGCGSVFEIGYVVYSKRAKHLCLGVNLQTIKTFGLTSEEVAKEMAVGALERSKADIAIAVTGTAESNDNLNGVVCFACAAKMKTYVGIISETVSFNGSRNEVRASAAHHAILQMPHYYQQLTIS